MESHNFFQKSLLIISFITVVFSAFAKENETWYPEALDAFEKGDYKTCQQKFHKYYHKSTGHYNRRYQVSVVPWFESAIALDDWDDAVDSFTKWPGYGEITGAFPYGVYIDGKRHYLTSDGLRNWVQEDAAIHNKIWSALVKFYWDKTNLFEKSPFVKHMGNLGIASLEQEKAILGKAIYDDAIASWNRNNNDPLSTDVLGLLDLAGNCGYDEAYILLANLYEQGGVIGKGLWLTQNVEIDLKTAFNYWKLLTDLNKSVGFHKCAQYFEYGYGKDVDYHLAIDYYKKSVALNNSGTGIANSSYIGLSSCYAAINDSISAFRTLSEAYDKGFYDVSNNLGEYYRHGKIVTKDLRKAFDIYNTGMKNCSYQYAKDFCKYQVAMMLKDGLGCAKDAQLAQKYLEESRDGNIILASYVLSQIYYDSSAYEKSMAECNRIINYKKRLPKGVLASTYQLLAKMYNFGRGTVLDEAKATEMWNKAAEYGNPDAMEIKAWLGF